MTVIPGRAGKVPIKVYVCSYHWGRGDTFCKNKARRPVDAVDEVVTDGLARNVIDGAFVVAAGEELRRRFAGRAQRAKTEVPALEREAARLRGRRVVLAAF